MDNDNNVITDNTNYAGFWQRFFAVIIDMAFYTPFYYAAKIGFGEAYSWWAEGFFAIFALLTYSWFFSSKMQGSLGMYILKFHICDTAKQRISFLHATIWGITSAIGWAISCAGVVYMMIRFDINAINDITMSCIEENIPSDECIKEIESMINIPYSTYENILYTSTGLALFLLFIWALSIALPKDKTGFHNLICRTRFVKGRA